MPGICVSYNSRTLRVESDDYPDCGTNIALPFEPLSATDIVNSSEFIDIMFQTEPSLFAAVFAATFSLPVTLYMVTYGYQSVISFFKN